MSLQVQWNKFRSTPDMIYPKKAQPKIVYGAPYWVSDRWKGYFGGMK